MSIIGDEFEASRADGYRAALDAIDNCLAGAHRKEEWESDRAWNAALSHVAVFVERQRQYLKAEPVQSPAGDGGNGE